MPLDRFKPWIINTREDGKKFPITAPYEQFCGWRGRYSEESSRQHTQFLNAKVVKGGNYKAGIKRREIERRLELRAMKLEFDSLL